MSKGSVLLPKSSIKAFTLIELIVVIIIVGILAAVGISQYSLMVEKSRLAEAKVRIGTMRQLAYQYYLENGAVAGMQRADLGIDNTCNPTDYYAYNFDNVSYAPEIRLIATRCSSGGKTPNSSLGYWLVLVFDPRSSATAWECNMPSGGGCFGYPPDHSI